MSEISEFLTAKSRSIKSIDYSRYSLEFWEGYIHRNSIYDTNHRLKEGDGFLGSCSKKGNDLYLERYYRTYPKDKLWRFRALFEYLIDRHRRDGIELAGFCGTYPIEEIPYEYQFMYTQVSEEDGQPL